MFHYCGSLVVDDKQAMTIDDSSPVTVISNTSFLNYRKNKSKKRKLGVKCCHYLGGKQGQQK